MDGGNVRLRSRPGSDVATVQWRRRMTTLQYTSFDTFVRATISNGTSRFTMPVWLGTSYVTKTVQVVKDLLVIARTAVHLRVHDVARVWDVSGAHRHGRMGRGRRIGTRIGKGLFHSRACSTPGSSTGRATRSLSGASQACPRILRLALRMGRSSMPGRLVLFSAIPFYADFPEFAEGRVPETRITVDNVSRELVPHIEFAMSVRADLIAIYREIAPTICPRRASVRSSSSCEHHDDGNAHRRHGVDRQSRQQEVSQSGLHDAGNIRGCSRDRPHCVPARADRQALVRERARAGCLRLLAPRAVRRA